MAALLLPLQSPALAAAEVAVQGFVALPAEADPASIEQHRRPRHPRCEPAVGRIDQWPGHGAGGPCAGGRLRDAHAPVAGGAWSHDVAFLAADGIYSLTLVPRGAYRLGFEDASGVAAVRFHPMATPAPTVKPSPTPTPAITARSTARIKGTAKVGHTLRVTRGTHHPATVTVKYR